MKNVTLILISLMFLTGCEKEVSELQDRDGIKYEINSNTPFNGRVVVNYSNGQKAYKGSFKDGKHEGTHYQWHTNGQLTEETNYKDGKLDGLYARWFESGGKKANRSYKNGVLVGIPELDEGAIFAKEIRKLRAEHKRNNPD